MSRLWWSPPVLFVTLVALKQGVGPSFDLYRVGMPLVVTLGLVGILRLPRRLRLKLSPAVLAGGLLCVGAVGVGRDDTVGLRWSQDVWSLLGLLGVAASFLLALGLFENGSTKRELLDVAALGAGFAAIGVVALSSGWESADVRTYVLAESIVIVSALVTAVGVVFLAPEARWNIAARWLLAGVQLQLVTYISFLAASGASNRSQWYVVSWLAGTTLLCCGVLHPSMRTLERRRREATHTQMLIAASSITTGVAGGAFALISSMGNRAVLWFGVVACVLAGARAMRAVEESWSARSQMRAMLERERDARDTERRVLRDLMHDDVVQMLSAASWLEEDTEARELVLRAQRRTSSLLNGERPLVPSFGAIESSLREVLASFGGSTQWEVVMDPGSETVTNAAAWAVVREAAVNVAKHARATHARVELVKNAEDVLVVVSDDGVGVSEAEAGMGWDNMRAVVSHAGGEIAIYRAESGGSVLEASIPL